MLTPLPPITGKVGKVFAETRPFSGHFEEKIRGACGGELNRGEGYQ